MSSPSLLPFAGGLDRRLYEAGGYRLTRIIPAEAFPSVLEGVRA